MPQQSYTTHLERSPAWNVALEQGGWLVSNEIKIDLAAVSSIERAETQAQVGTGLGEREAARLSA